MESALEDSSGKVDRRLKEILIVGLHDRWSDSQARGSMVDSWEILFGSGAVRDHDVAQGDDGW